MLQTGPEERLYTNCSDSLRLLFIKYLFRRKTTVLSITLDEMEVFEEVCNCLYYYSPNFVLLLMVLQGLPSWVL